MKNNYNVDDTENLCKFFQKRFIKPIIPLNHETLFHPWEYTEPNYPEPNYPEPNYPEPNYPEPNYPEPNYPEPNYPEPNYPEPNYPENIPSIKLLPHGWSSNSENKEFGQKLVKQRNNFIQKKQSRLELVVQTNKFWRKEDPSNNPLVQLRFYRHGIHRHFTYCRLKQSFVQKIWEVDEIETPDLPKRRVFNKANYPAFNKANYPVFNKAKREIKDEIIPWYLRMFWFVIKFFPK
jgi:hypothetical protein